VATTIPQSAASSVSSARHYAALDGIRGIAILLVFAVHYGDLSHATSPLLRVVNEVKSWGWIGVDLFFVLSGFLITGILYDSRNSRSYYRTFYIRRALRLFPVFYGLMFVLLLLTPVLHVHWRWGHLGVLFYGANIAYAFDASLQDAGLAPLGPLWTLAVEEQFYLLWPAAVRKLRNRESLLKLTLALIVVAFAGRIVALQAGVPTDIVHWELPTRMDSLAVGAALALLLRGPRVELWRRVARNAFLPLCAALLAIRLYAGTFDMQNKTVMEAGYLVLAFAAAALIAETLRTGSWAHRFFSNRVLRFLGRISYGFYIYHALPWRGAKPLNAYLLSTFHSQLLAGLGVYAIYLTGITLFAWLSFRFFEQPFLRLKDKLAPPEAETQS
jgi:peptidoglycan/LPS O-acetylase OafA/YrhL